MTLRALHRRLLTSVFAAASSVAFVSCLAAQPEETSISDPCADRSSPSKLDYLVLASIADSPRPLSLEGYWWSNRGLDAREPADEAAADSAREP